MNSCASTAVAWFGSISLITGRARAALANANVMLVEQKSVFRLGIISVIQRVESQSDAKRPPVCRRLESIIVAAPWISLKQSEWTVGGWDGPTLLVLGGRNRGNLETADRAAVGPRLRPCYRARKLLPLRRL